MPGSTAETVYGRRGGGWIPKTRPPATSTPPPLNDDKCQQCGRLASKHTLCPLCRGWVEHHAAGGYEIEVQARARMASCKDPEDRNELDVWALGEWGGRPLGKAGEELTPG